MVSAAHPLTRDNCSSAGLNMHGTRCPPSISRKAFSLFAGMSEHPRVRAPAPALELLEDAILEEVDEPGHQRVEVAARGGTDLSVVLRSETERDLIEVDTFATDDAPWS